MTQRVFIDGAAGTTGLEIRERLAGRTDIALVTLADADRRDAAARADALRSADIVILCLPDDAAREAVALIGNAPTRVIDASTAHRVDPAWAYGFPELEPGGRETIAAARRVANPGCYATGFLALVRPLVRRGLLPADALLGVNAVSGYSGGGKAMISAYEGGGTTSAHRAYALDLAHKHIPEMRAHAGLATPPIFAPAVARTYRGMIVEVPLHLAQLRAGTTAARVHRALADAYAGALLVRVAPLAKSAALAGLAIEHAAGTDRLDLFMFANPATGQFRLAAALDNLGKGAAGAAVQNLNLMANLPETAGLRR